MAHSFNLLMEVHGRLDNDHSVFLASRRVGSDWSAGALGDVLVDAMKELRSYTDRHPKDIAYVVSFKVI